ncbi:YetF domain-containing protein [Priestia filamentosa]|uniref:YetF domain-containing protein n=1 Tax=Priestia filamentosa TaxID=1402861 RepID=UPI0002F0EF53|nr:DUF421 domain-containing protein [Priestia filamentosa]
MNHYLAIAIDLFFGFIVLFIITKVLGRNQFSQITPFDFISALILGELLGNAVYDPGINVKEIIFAAVLWCLLIYTTEMFTQKVKKVRKLLEGEPIIVIRRGQLQYEALAKGKLDLNQLQNLLRQQGFFSIEEVEFAILETNGIISVLPKSQYAPPNTEDLHLELKPVYLPVTLIIDGEVLYDNLTEAGFNEEWLQQQLANHNIFDYKDVIFAEWRKGKPFFFQKYE